MPVGAGVPLRQVGHDRAREAAPEERRGEMTGIERLREVATRVEDGGCVSPGGECRREGGVTCRSCLADELYGIADQMEAELVGNDAGRVCDGQGRYHTPSGQDESCRSAVARPACGAAPQEDRAAAAWVRERGGLDERVTTTKPEPPDSAERIAEDIKRMAKEWCSHPTLREASEMAASSVGEATMGVALSNLAKRCRALAERERGE